MRGIPVSGGDLEIRQPDGSIAQAGACETGDRLIGRADHPEYSFEQLARKREVLGELSRSEESRQEWMERIEHQLGAHRPVRPTWQTERQPPYPGRQSRRMVEQETLSGGVGFGGTLPLFACR